MQFYSGMFRFFPSVVLRFEFGLLRRFGLGFLLHHEKEHEHKHAIEHAPYLVFILLLSIIALILLAIETMCKLDESTKQILRYTDHAVCVAFFGDFLYTLFHLEKENKAKYLVKRGWLDLLSCIPVLDVLLWSRAARIMRIFRLLRVLKSAKIICETIYKKRHQSIGLAITLVYIILITVCSISVLHFEVAVDGPIKTPEDALWWSVVTVTSVGYGDKVPVTTEGRLVATILMFAGIGLIGTFSGYIAAVFIGPVAFKKDSKIDYLDIEIKQIKNLLNDIKRTNSSA